MDLFYGDGKLIRASWINCGIIIAGIIEIFFFVDYIV